MEVVITDQNFMSEVAQSKGVVLIDFWAPWCGPCRMQGPIVEEIAKELASTPNVKIGKMNVDENAATAQQFQIMSIPTLILFKDGKPVDQMIGLQSKESLIQRIKKQAV